VLSIVAVLLESVDSIRDAHGAALRATEWAFTLLFTAEYILRLISVPRASHYARSFFGVVDLLAILPTYVSFLFPGAQTLLVIRALRLLRIFRVFKLVRFLGEANVLRLAMRGSRHKVIVFLGTILILVTILGSAMYLIEGEKHGFTSIPISIYWAIVTMTTVGYGDIAPQTFGGRALASLVMILGYSIIAIPTGIFTAELMDAAFRARAATTRACRHCMSEGHEKSARFCKDCGGNIEPDTAT
jgi:voltage-gated potassium channel